MQGSVFSEEGLSSREVNILKKQMTNNKREERRRKFVIRNFQITKEGKVIESSIERQKEAEIGIREWLKDMGNCNIVIREREDVLVKMHQ